MELGLGTSITLRRNLAEFIETLQVSIFSPNSSPLQAGTVEFSGSATGPNPITTLEYQIDDGAFTSFTVAENWTVDITLGVSNTSVTIRATDDTLATATDTFNFTVVASDTQLPITTSLEADYDILGTAVITEDNTLSVKTAQSWEEESADQHTIANLTKAEQPVYDDVNDEVEFDGQDDILSGAFTSFSTANTTIFAYLKSPETTDVKSLFSVYQNGNADTAFSHGVEFGLVDGKATCWYGDGTNNQMIQESVATDHTSYQVWEFVNDGGTRRFLIDGTEIGNSTTAYSIAVDRLQMGGRGTVNFADCDIKTVFFYTDSKSSGDRTTLRNHINSRFAPADVTAPVLTNATGTSTGATTADGTVDTDEANGTLYWVVTQNATTPSAAQIKTGNDHTGTVADDSGNQVVNATGTQNVSSTGLVADTVYYFHFMHEDSSTNQSSAVTSNSFEHSTATLDADAQAWINEINAFSATTVDATHETAIDNFVKNCKTGITNGTNVWTKLLRVRLHASQAKDHGFVDGKNPTTVAKLVDAGSTAAGFTADQGIIGGSGVSVTSTFNPTNDGQTSSNAGLSAYLHSYTSGDIILWILDNRTRLHALLNKLNSTNLDDLWDSELGSVTMTTRGTSNPVEWRNGVQKKTSGSVAGAVGNDTEQIFHPDFGAVATLSISAWHTELTNNEIVDFHNAMEAYMDELGTGVIP